MPTTLTGTSLAHALPSARRPSAKTTGTVCSCAMTMMLLSASSRPPVVNDKSRARRVNLWLMCMTTTTKAREVNTANDEAWARTQCWRYRLVNSFGDIVQLNARLILQWTRTHMCTDSRKKGYCSYKIYTASGMTAQRLGHMTKIKDWFCRVFGNQYDAHAQQYMMEKIVHPTWYMYYLLNAVLIT